MLINILNCVFVFYVYIVFIKVLVYVNNENYVKNCKYVWVKIMIG